ncbi:LIP domain containing protein [Hyaloscypha variabilis]
MAFSMMRLLSGLLLLWSIFTDRALGQENSNATLSIPPPSQDPWFKPPANWTLAPLGTALKVRASPYKQINIGHCIDTFQILYRTTDTHNNASWAVTTVFIPESNTNCNLTTNPEACAHGIVSYQVPYDTADPDASPSYLLQYGEPYGEINDLLVRGWFVSVPDYEGTLASYCEGVQSGAATLDSLIAVLQVAGDFGLRRSLAKVALWGYSGGALATAFAAEMAAEHSPGLEIAGAVFGGTSPNLTTVGQRMNGKDTAGLLIAGTVGLTSQYPRARDDLVSRMYTNGTYNATRFLAAEHMSAWEALNYFMYDDAYKYFINGESDLYSPIMQNVTNLDGIMGEHGTPNMPIFLYKAIDDEMSPAWETDELVDSYCSHGANILYHRNVLGGHNQELWAGRGRTMDFLSAVLDGTNAIEYPKTGCEIKNVTVAVNLTIAANGTYLVLPLNVTEEANGTYVFSPLPQKAVNARHRMDILNFLGR